MARTKTYAEPAPKPGIMSRLRARPARQAPPPPRAKIIKEESTNPITGTHTQTTKRKTHPKGFGHHGHGGRGPLASEKPVVSHTQRRKPGIGDKLSGAMMKMKGEATGKPGVKAAGTRRMHGTDGRVSRRRY